MPRIPSSSNTISAISTRRPSEPPTLSHSKSSSFATPLPSRSSSGQFSNTPSRASPAMSRLGSASPAQVNSLGRTTQVAGSGSSTVAREGSPVPRRNSLGDLKIPSRISRAQDGLKKDLTRVKEFASHVERKPVSFNLLWII